ncbi:neutral zinc metallopeptidase [Aquidulcibacter sp.]|uniref:KPN_02809 family neutral zinc metallopeptidase n=1 Tax=Aquidulcibacter sp. TaxID=2052990 RepID=UPI0028A99CE8|nr:neutral zinc metallopeptidase [Aquidulcibacter sp.]
MRLDDIRRSSNIEDRRGGGGGGGGSSGGGGGPRLPLRGRGGIAMIVVVLLLVFFGGGDTMGTLMSILGAGSGLSSQQGGFQAEPAPPKGMDKQASSSRSDAETADRVAAVLGSTEEFWTAHFARNGLTYTPATLVLFDNQTSSPCGKASASTGPFYCPGDKKIYLDLSFFEEMDRGLGAKGDFAQAYVIAHEVAHHVQDVTGILPRANRAMRKQGQSKGAGSIAVRIELQADCYAGLWAGQSNITAALEPGDIGEALGAASAVGDDRLQKRAQGFAVPDSFTHGTSVQRMTWFKEGLGSGDLRGCDTFSARDL